MAGTAAADASEVKLSRQLPTNRVNLIVEVVMRQEHQVRC
jgi:hypothetical protein